jgi:hypothetical protein
MYKIKIENGKATKTSWDTEARSNVTKEITSLVPYLDCPIELENTTFGQFFAFIERDKDFYNQAYRSATYGFPIAPYFEEIKKPAELGPREWSPRPFPKNPLNLDYVEVYWGVDMEDGVISDYPGFHGWGDWDDKNYPGHKGGIALEFTATHQYKDVTLKLDHEFEIFDENLKSIFKTKKIFRVHDVVRAILYEITWSGDITKGRECPFDDKSLST